MTQLPIRQLSEADGVGGTTPFAPVTVPEAVMLPDGSTMNKVIGSVAVIETSPAAASHAAGDYIVWNGQLYKVTAAISAGQTLTVGTNITATTAGAELASLNNDLTTNIAIERKEIVLGQCSPNVDYTKTLDISKTGYSPLGIIGFHIQGTYGTHFHVSRADITSYTNAMFSIRANSTLTFTTDNTVISFVVLYKQRQG